MPQTVYDVGDTIVSRLKLGVTPDDTTTVTVEWRKPTGAAEAATPPAGPVNGDEWTSQITTSTPGDYVAVWTVAPGTGAGVQAKVYSVRALPDASDTRPAWAPSLERVATYVPRRTIVGDPGGTGLPTGTFNGSTRPTDEHVIRLIDDACAWVMLATGDVNTTLTAAASTTAALRAAAAVELGYPDNRDDLSNGSQLLEQATAMRADLARRNEVLTGADVEDPAAHLLPVYSFPSPVPWGDTTFL